MNQQQYDRDSLDDHYQHDYVDWPGNPIRKFFSRHEESSVLTYIPKYKSNRQLLDIKEEIHRPLKHSQH